MMCMGIHNIMQSTMTLWDQLMCNICNVLSKKKRRKKKNEEITLIKTQEVEKLSKS